MFYGDVKNRWRTKLRWAPVGGAASLDTGNDVGFNLARWSYSGVSGVESGAPSSGGRLLAAPASLDTPARPKAAARFGNECLLQGMSWLEVLVLVAPLKEV